jgi:hypothetical protein
MPSCKLAVFNFASLKIFRDRVKELGHRTHSSRALRRPSKLHINPSGENSIVSEGEVP